MGDAYDLSKSSRVARSTKQEQGDNDICGVRLPARLAVVTGLGSQAYSGAAKLWKKDLSAPAEGRQKLQKVLVEGKVVRAMFETWGRRAHHPAWRHLHLGCRHCGRHASRLLARELRSRSETLSEFLWRSYSIKQADTPGRFQKSHFFISDAGRPELAKGRAH